MKSLRILIATFGLVALSGKVFAQPSASVDFKVTMTPKAGTTGLLNLGGFSDYLNLIASGNAETSASRSATLVVDQPMVITLAQFNNVDSYILDVTAPPEFETVIEGIRQREYRDSSTDANGFASTVTVTLVRRGKSGGRETQPVGEAGSITYGDPQGAFDYAPINGPYVEFNLGNRINGASLPPLRVLLIPLFTNSGAIPIPNDPEITRATSVTTTALVLDAPETTVRLTLDPANNGNFTLSFCAPGGTTPFVTYGFDFSQYDVNYRPSTTANVRRVTKTLGGRTYETITSYNSDPGWLIEDWHVVGAAPNKVLAFNQTYTPYSQPYTVEEFEWEPPATIVRTVTAKAGRGATAATSDVTSYEYKEYRRDISGDASIDYRTRVVASAMTRGGAGTPTETYLYDIQLGDSTGVKEATGRTSIAMDNGTTRTVYETWLNSSPTFNGTSSTDIVTENGCAKTVTTYSSGVRWVTFKWPTDVEKRVGPQLLSKSTITYSDVTGNDDLVQSIKADYVDATTNLQTTTKTYRPDASDVTLRDEVYSVQYPGGLMKAFAYEHGTYDATTQIFTPGSGPDFQVSVLSGTVSGGTAVTATKAGGATVDAVGMHVNRSTMEKSILHRGRLVRSETWVFTGGSGAAPSFENVAWENRSYTTDGRVASSLASTGASYTAAWSGSRKTSEQDETGLITSSNVDTDFDDSDRMIGSTRASAGPTGAKAPALRTEYSYDAVDRLVETRVGTTTEQMVSKETYGLDGRIAERVVPGGAASSSSANPTGLKTTFTYDDSTRTTIETVAAGTSLAATKTTVAFSDGRTSTVTGTAVTAQSYAYGFDLAGLPQTTISIGATQQRQTIQKFDLLGRLKEEWQYGFLVNGVRKPIVKKYTYNAFGKLAKVVTVHDPDGAAIKFVADTLYTYDALGEVAASGLDVNGNGTLDEVLDVNGDGLVNDSDPQDRFTGNSVSFVKENSAWWLVRQQSVYYNKTSGASFSTSVRTRLTGFATGVVSQTRTVDQYGNSSWLTVSYDTTSNTRSETIKATDGTSITRMHVGGQLIRETSLADDDTTTLTLRTLAYDAVGRVTSETDARGVASTVDYYVGTSEPRRRYGRNAANTADVQIAEYDYDGAGHVVHTTTPVAEVRAAYNRRGQLLRRWGSGTKPVSYAYDEFGQQIAFRTFRSSALSFTGVAWPLSDDGGDPLAPDPTSWTSGDATTFSYDAATGWLDSKKDAAGRLTRFAYSYEGDYRVVTRTSPRNVSSASKYLRTTGDLMVVDYSDATPDVTYTRTRTGLIDSVTDAAGTRDLVYDHEQLSAEGLDATWYNGLILTRLFDNTSVQNTAANLVPGRYAGVELGKVGDLGSEFREDVTFDDRGRVQGLTIGYAAKPGRSALSVSGTYAYSQQPFAWSKFTQGSFTQARTLEPGRDVLANVSAGYGSTVLAQYDYETNAAFQRTTVTQRGVAFGGYGGPTHSRYGYNDAGELQSATAYTGAATAQTPAASNALPGRSLGYDYDLSGNRKTASLDGDSVSYYGDTAATSDAANNLNQVRRRGNLRTHVSGAANSTAAVSVNGGGVVRGPGASASYWDAGLGSFAQIASIQVTASLAGNTESKTISALLRPSEETLAYDLDGNLSTDGVWSYTWDAENRLIGMTNTAAQAWGMPAQTITFTYDYMGRRVRKQDSRGVDRKYVYDGWNLLAEIDAATNAVVRSYAWGLDVQSSATAAGGVGGLVLETAHTSSSLTPYNVAYDANGNVTALVSSAGALAAVYEYDPFGQLLRKTGTEAANNPFRFSTKFQDVETGLIYYGYRYYDPGLGRFINRDPLSEEGGANLYALLGNDGINRVDYLGMVDLDKTDVIKELQDMAKAEHGIFIVKFKNGELRYDADKGTGSITWSEDGASKSVGLHRVSQPGDDAEWAPTFIVKGDRIRDFSTRGAFANSMTDDAAGDWDLNWRHIGGRLEAFARGVYVKGPTNLARSVRDAATGKTMALIAKDYLLAMLDRKGPLAGAKKMSARYRAGLFAEFKRLATTDEGGGELVFMLATAGLAKGVRIGPLASESEYVNLASAQRTIHILEGDATGGGHMFPGAPGKTPFPEGWSAEKIMHEVSDIATDPDLEWVQQTGKAGSWFTKAGDAARFIVIGEREGVQIKVVLEPAGEGIITAHPLN